MSFSVTAEAYDRFMGRYSTRLARPFADLAGIEAGWRVLDVGCGPGALLGELVPRVGVDRVVGVDPAAGFVTAATDRYPGIVTRQACTERLPFDDNSFDAALAQLVVHFMSDPVAGLTEMARVTVGGGVVAACVWDFHEGGSPLSTFWAAAADLDPDAPGEQQLPGCAASDLRRLVEAIRARRRPGRCLRRWTGNNGQAPLGSAMPSGAGKRTVHHRGDRVGRQGVRYYCAS